ncbi:MULTISPECIES: hypothetical protein [unclassified Actinomyces]|uniref:hypothetical protein n=1 Tax=unclassified Actinomyces TaxID=2609248 RepID=UPI0020171610|nr:MULTISPECIES: hypothetical protein [unclassified Actinomyces]MCL3777195.1 hypothetical protein [Actinomyces sp. AC-20-1]MCL3788981.1 hypothetical protein [Actinomyces sp. 187325]MCL3791336.1 hypothetical protein [Actinomyces sp. 186855]MCL3793953.1 hypothetical protein [Actinomyces sp. 217892]
MSAKQRKKSEPRSRYYWILVVVCLLLGLPAAVWIYVEIGNHVSGSVRIPVILLLIPLIVLLFVAGWIDSQILSAAPQLVRRRDRATLAAALGYDPVTRQPVAPTVPGAVPSGYPGPTAVGYPQPGSPQAQPGQAGAALPYGQAQPGYGTGVAGDGASPAVGYPTASAPYGQPQYGQAAQPTTRSDDGAQPPTSYGY